MRLPEVVRLLEVVGLPEEGAVAFGVQGARLRLRAWE